MATTGETARWLDLLIGRNGAGLSDTSHASLLDDSSGATFTAGLWTYCPCAEDENGPLRFALGTTGTDVMAFRARGSGLTVVAHAADQIWDPPGRNTALQDLLRDIDYIERLGKAPAKHPVLVGTGVASTVHVGNLTITQPSTAGYATTFPCASGLPPTSNVNFAADETVANLTLVATDAAGELCITPSADAHVIFDHSATLGGVTSYRGVRALDTRAGPRPAAGTALRVHVGDAGTVVAGNLTITQPATAGYATVYPCLAGLPPTSNVNFAAGRTVANLTLPVADANGDVCIVASTAAHVIFDHDARLSSVTPGTPTRALDTRRGARPAARTTVRVALGAADTVFVGNLTITQPETAGYATVYPCLAGIPPTSNINFAAGQTVANLTLTPTDANGDLCITASTGAHVIFDHAGTISSITTHPAVRAIDTRN